MNGQVPLDSVKDHLPMGSTSSAIKSPTTAAAGAVGQAGVAELPAALVPKGAFLKTKLSTAIKTGVLNLSDCVRCSLV